MPDQVSRKLFVSGDMASWLQRALLRPVWSIAVLGAVALGIELAQYWPERFVGGHAIGEFVRSLAYSLIVAIVFNWILIEIPARRRRRLAYARHHVALDFILKLGPAWLAEYRGVADRVNAAHRDPNAWNRESLEQCARSIHDANPDYFGAARRQMLAQGISAVQLSLNGMETANYFFDADVAVALALFPAEQGLHQLQPPPPDLAEPWKRDVHIVWELLKASQNLYEALRSCVPDLEFKLEEGSVVLSDGSIWHVNQGDLVRA